MNIYLLCLWTNFLSLSVSAGKFWNKTENVRRDAKFIKIFNSLTELIEVILFSSVLLCSLFVLFLFFSKEKILFLSKESIFKIFLAFSSWYYAAFIYYNTQVKLEHAYVINMMTVVVQRLFNRYFLFIIDKCKN